ncbi:hypothetical protein C8F01DRAFT_1146202 [Mycena amicta]|nr:hypothetical protein C8F01DRAFT_1146202 [Mycena amicta]
MFVSNMVVFSPLLARLLPVSFCCPPSPVALPSLRIRQMSAGQQTTLGAMSRGRPEPWIKSRGKCASNVRRLEEQHNIPAFTDSDKPWTSQCATMPTACTPRTRDMVGRVCGDR